MWYFEIGLNILDDDVDFDANKKSGSNVQITLMVALMFVESKMSWLILAHETRDWIINCLQIGVEFCSYCVASIIILTKASIIVQKF